jgi:hypothetical protein
MTAGPGQRGRLATAAAALALTGLAGWYALRTGAGPLPDPEQCIASVGGHSVALDLEQAENASIIAGIGVARGLPARAVSIALATAYQESDIRNLDHGDRDSLGLFQQRPSQGWGTASQVQDPFYATNAFYDALEQVDGYQDMPITEAAQEVQRSAFGGAYADHEADARALASALTGYSAAEYSCTIHAQNPGSQQLGPNGLTSRADIVRRDLRRVFGSLPMGGFAPGGVSTGHSADSAHYEGRAIDVFVRPLSADNTRKGWAISSYLVGNADRLSVATVIFADRIWTATRSDEGWRAYHARSTDPTLRHLDHVHVDVE